MSRRDYVKAYALLEQSLGEQPFFEHGTDCPEQWHPQDTYHKVAPTDTALDKKTNCDEFIHNPRNMATSSQILTPSRTVDGYEAVLPPTPLSNTNLTNSSAGLTNGMSSCEHHQSRPSTPTYPRGSLPTPDTTPPSWTSYLTPKPSSSPRFSSPDADSFKTASEQQGPVIANRSRNHLPLNDNMESNRTKMWLNSGKLAGFEAVLRHRRAVSDLSKLPDNSFDGMNEVDDVVDEEWMKNVTSWSKRPAATTTPPMHINNESHGSMPSLMQGLGFRHNCAAKHGSSEYSPTQLSIKERVPSRMNGMPSDVRERTYKRWSGTSVSSTVIEAFIVDTPPQRKRKLRHVSKITALREVASLSDYSNRTSIMSDEAPVHQLHHMRKNVPERSHRDSIGSDMSTSTFSHPLRRRRESIPVSSRLRRLGIVPWP